ncbi:hypothetical protein Plhal304r1_c010g0040211 [Plasmopara halstedii]
MNRILLDLMEVEADGASTEAKLSKESEDLSRGFVSGQHQHHAHTEGLIDFEFCGITRDEDFEFQRILRGPTELLKGL